MAKKKIPTIPKEWTKKPIYWIVLIVILAAIYFYNNRGNDKTDKAKIEDTSISITSIKNIAEWEFLTIQTEEMIDTTIKRTISDDHFARIYSGTVRLGVDMKKGRKNWIECRGDSAIITLPAIEMLDKNFIDETKTRTFYENGNMSATVKNKMLSKAKKNIKQRALTTENIQNAQENAITQFTLMFNALGYKNVIVNFKDK